MSNHLIYRPLDHTPAEWRDLANKRADAAIESFDRCDTDGFRSQEAYRRSADTFRELAKVAENGGKGTFPGLTRADSDELLDARLVNGKFGLVWRINTADGGVEWFNPSTARKGSTRRTNDAKKGYREVYFEADAVMIDYELIPARDGKVYGLASKSPYDRDF